ncbi:hypothetical protein B7G60_14835, partial [Staphylococcus aureus]
TPGEGSIQIDTDPKNATHMTLLQLAAERAEVGVATHGEERCFISGYACMDFTWRYSNAHKNELH